MSHRLFHSRRPSEVRNSTPFATWRSRLPATIGSWFSRDLVRSALALVSGECVVLRVVEDNKLEAKVAGKDVSVEWGGGTGPLALRPTCTCGSSGICEHVIASLEFVRSQMELAEAPTANDPDLSWLPVPRLGATGARARCVWIVFSTASDGVGLNANLVLDSPRLRGAVRDAASIVAMMDSSPQDDWDEADRDLMHDETIYEAFGGNRNATKALARALFRCARHPRLRFDDDVARERHPSELPEFAINVHGVALQATRQGGEFLPLFVAADETRLVPADVLLIDGPPTWIATPRSAYLLDGTFDYRKSIEISRANRAQTVPSTLPESGFSSTAITRVAAYLAPEDRRELGIVDATDPTAEFACSWLSGALVASLTFIDRASKTRAPYASLGTITAYGAGYIRFSSEFAAQVRTRLLGAGFVPRGTDGFALHGTDRAAEFVREILPTWTDFDIRLDGALRDLVSGIGELDIAVSARKAAGEGDNWFELAVDVFIDKNTEALTQQELSALLATSGRYADVRGKLVDVSKLRERSALMSDLAERRQSGLAALLALRDELHENFSNVALPPDVERLRERLRNFSGIVPVEVPTLQDGELRSYQQRGLDFLSYLASFNFGGILADEMGLGKTIQVISYLLRRKHDDGQVPSLVVAPTSVTHTWEREIERFAPELTTLRLHSGSERALRYDEIQNVDVVITSYALARLDANILAQYRFRSLILDEAQNAKNPSSQIAKVLRALHAEHRLALTGTPVENSLRDLWAIFAFVEPGLLGSEASFRRRFEIPISQNNETASLALRSRLEPFLLRRTKEDVAPELPARTEVVLECDLSPLQRRLYRGVAEAARRDILAKVDEGGIEHASVHVLAALTRLRQICAHPGLLFEEYRTTVDASAKFEAFIETVEEVLSGGHRLLVFSAFASMLKLIRAQLDVRNINYGYLDGSTKDKDRQLEVARFMEPDGPSLFLCSLKAGGVGLTLTAADYVILYDPWWNPAVERQAIDRTHRIGQTRPVTAYRMVTRGTVEEKIRTLAERKVSLSKNVIRADSAFTKSLTREDLENLFAEPPAD